MQDKPVSTIQDQVPSWTGHLPVFISGEILHKALPTKNLVFTQKLADSFNKILPLYKMDNRDIFEEFFARCCVESGEFTKFTENLNYSAQGLADTWPERYAIDPKAKIKVPNALANKLNRKPEAIANNAYANRMGNGDEKSGDGWKHRGGGPIMITGKSMWQAYANYKKVTVDFVIDKVRNDLDWAIDSACWVFAVVKGLIDEAIADDIKEIVKKINGGLIGYNDTIKYLNIIKKVFPII